METEFKQENAIPDGVFDPTESVKFTKNTKGFNWEFKLKEEKITTETLKRLDELNKYMEINYGNQGD